MCEDSAMCMNGGGAGGLCACALQCCCSFAVRLLPPRRDQRTRGAMQTNSSAETETASYRRRCATDVETAQTTQMNWNATTNCAGSRIGSRVLSHTVPAWQRN